MLSANFVAPDKVVFRASYSKIGWMSTTRAKLSLGNQGTLCSFNLFLWKALTVAMAYIQLEITRQERDRLPIKAIC